MPNEPQSDQTLSTPPVPSVISKGERILDAGSIPETGVTPVEPSPVVAPETEAAPPPAPAAVVHGINEPPKLPQPPIIVGDVSHIPMHRAGLLDRAGNAIGWIVEKVTRETSKGKIRLKTKTV